MELRGCPVHALETELASRKSCCCSRSFGEATSDRRHVHDAIVAFASRAAEKIRRDGLVAGVLQVFISTDRYRRDAPQYSNSVSMRLSPPSNDTAVIVRAAVKGMNGIWQADFKIRKAGVLLQELVTPGGMQADLFFHRPAGGKSQALMDALDGITARFGRGAVGFGLADKAAPWRMRQDACSPSYTTKWEDVPLVRA